MSFPKILLISSIGIFAVIGTTAMLKKAKNRPVSEKAEAASPRPQKSVQTAAPQEKMVKEGIVAFAKAAAEQSPQKSTAASTVSKPVKDGFVDIDRIHLLFSTGPTKLPIVETVSYTSRVPWLKGRPAWIADYAVYYATSRHFIARSLNGRSDYFTQKVSTGSKFNVFRKDKHVNFHLVIDISRCKMAFYYFDLDSQERVLLKTYQVGVGRLDPQKPSGTLTPVGKYSIGNKVAIYKPGTMGYFQDQKTEMVRVFGTRWMPLEQAVEGAAAGIKGYGIHGAPWLEENGQLVENRSCVGKYESDGSIRMKLEDMEELFSILITKPAFVEIVKNFSDAVLPGVEVVVPTR